MNQVNLIGRITREPEIRMTSNGKAYCHFTLAVRKEYEVQDGQPDADFINCSAWGKTADCIGKYIHKGEQMGVTGSIRQRTFENTEGRTVYITEVLVNRIDFIGSKKDAQATNAAQWTDYQTNAKSPAFARKSGSPSELSEMDRKNSDSSKKFTTDDLDFDTDDLPF